MSIPDAVIQQGITSDAVYIGSLGSDFADERYASFVSIVSLCMVPYLSLVVHESYRKLEAGNPALAASLSQDVKEIVERSRHTLKLFEDHHRWIPGQIAYFRDAILAAHASYFLGPLPAGFGNDLGIFSYDQKPILTSHSSAFNLGIEPAALLNMLGSESREIYRQYGNYWRQLGARLDVPGKTFVSHMDAQKFNQEPDDVRADAYYPRIFDGADNTYLNALLTVFRCMMNFIDTIVSAGATANGIEYTVFKIRFLTLYAVLASLQRLYAERSSYNLTPRSVQFMEQIVQAPENQVITAQPAKPFRNTLMHYNLNSHVNLTRVSLTEPLFGLVPIYFPAYNTATFAALVNRCIAKTSAAMNEWAGA